ncbi:hypothetical protein C4J97_2639 [Pseudomonas orientalis]|nr:hypothetical protein C4J97_2639 [Pseudomonas orientalis]
MLTQALALPFLRKVKRFISEETRKSLKCGRYCIERLHSAIKTP